MNEKLICRTTCFAFVLSVIVVALIGAAWWVGVVDHRLAVAAMLANTACVLSAASATLFIKTYAVRTCAVLRAVTLREESKRLESVR